MEEIKNSASQIMLVSQNVPDTEDSTIKSQSIKILMALKLSYLVPINLDVNMVTMLCVHSLIMTALNWMDPQGR